MQSVKYGCELAGLTPGPPRLPPQSQAPEEMSELEQVISTLKIEVSEILDGN